MRRHPQEHMHTCMYAQWMQVALLLKPHVSLNETMVHLKLLAITAFWQRLAWDCGHDSLH